MIQAVFILFVFLPVSLGQDAVIEPTLQINEAVRDLDLSTQIVKISTKFQIENTGSSSMKYFIYALTKAESDKLAYLAGYQVGRNDDKVKLKSSRNAVQNGILDVVYYKIDLPKALSGGQKISIEVVTYLTHSLRPYPSHIQQADQQFVVFEGNLHVLSGYEIRSEKSTVKLAPGTVHTYSKDKQPVKQEGSTIIYGPYDDIKPYSRDELRVHSENNSPFLVVNKLTRVIEVSHWGNIAVEETLELTHTGAILKGAFSRFDFQRDRRDKIPAVQSFKTVLPASAKDVYYRDEIGNISTSHLRVMDEAVEMEIRPRFPLFGGWKTNYYIGYNVPSYEYLFVSGNNFVLKMRFVDHIFDNFIVDEMILKVILPEQSKNIKLVPPYKVKRSDDEVHHTYLDYTGRPVVIADKSNVVEPHIENFELHYTFDRMALLQEPLMVIVAFFLMFLVVIVWVRLDFTVSKDAASESRLKVAGLLEEVTELQARRIRSYDSWSDAIGSYKKNKDPASLSTGRKKAEADLKNLTQQIGDLQAQLKVENPESAEKVGELQRLDKTAKEHLSTWMQQTERLVGGKLQKVAHAEAEKQARQKLEEIREKMENIVYSL